MPFMAISDRIAKNIRITDDGCWEWCGRRNRSGYGVMLITVGRKRQKMRFVHRLSYQAFRGPLTDGLVLDHLCRNRACCNPDHLDEVTDLENRRRGIKNPFATHCVNGHEYDDKNTYFERTRYGRNRKCRTCNRAAVARYKARRAQLQGLPS